MFSIFFSLKMKLQGLVFFPTNIIHVAYKYLYIQILEYVNMLNMLPIFNVACS